MRQNLNQQPLEKTEMLLIKRILHGTYATGDELPGERGLADELGVTRPTLREVLRGLERDGWVKVQHGKRTVVNDVWLHGGLNVLSAIVRYGETIPRDFVIHLLNVRLVLAPAYTRDAVDQNSAAVIALFDAIPSENGTPVEFARFDWALQHGLTVASGNPVYTLMFNGFAGIYRPMAELYFQAAEARQSSHQYYRTLLDCARRGSGSEAENVTREIMQTSITLWQKVQHKD